MKKSILILSLFLGLTLTGCQQLEQNADALKEQSQKTLEGTSQQIEDTKNKFIETKLKIDQKSQQAVDASNAVQKLAN